MFYLVDKSFLIVGHVSLFDQKSVGEKNVVSSMFPYFVLYLISIVLHVEKYGIIAPMWHPKHK